jgi:mono/diheme cytochrome c family protein
MTFAKNIGIAALLAVSSVSQASGQEDRGEYLVRIMDCTGCHTPGALLGQPEMDKALSGGNVGFQIPGLGVFYPPNLTSHATGAGSWTEEQIIAAVTEGKRPDGRQLVPIMPYHAYAALTAEDAHALARYLKSTAPIDNKVPGPIGPNEKPPLPYMTVQMPQ